MYKKTFTLLLACCLAFSLFLLSPIHANSDYAIETQIIDSVGDSAHDMSLALDSNGYPHVSYTDGNFTGLKYAWWNGTSWTKQLVEDEVITPGHSGFESTLKLDSNNNPHICYFHPDETFHLHLRYAYWNGSAWVIQTVDQFGEGRHASLALDSQGFPHISYYGDSSLKYASWNGNQWVIQVVDRGLLYHLSIGTFSSLQIDPENNPHIAYDDDTNDLLKYASWKGSNWVIETVDLGSISDMREIEVSLVLGSGGKPHLSYVLDGNLKYAELGVSGWELQTIDATGSSIAVVGESVSLAFDSNGLPHLSYIDQYRGSRLKYAYFNGSSWNIYGLSNPAQGGYSTSLAVDVHDKVCIVHGDYTSHAVEYLYFNPFEFGSPSVVPDPTPITPPPIMVVQSEPAGLPTTLDHYNTGMYTSIAVDDQGNLHISYYDADYGLKHAFSNSSTNWYIEAVDVNRWTGRYTSVALDSNGYPHISYCNLLTRSLNYAYWNGLQWNKQVIDLDSVGSLTSIVLDSHNYAHISYFDFGNESLKYAEWDGSNWLIQTVDSVGYVGEFTSIALDSNGQPCISYYDIINGNLKYARRTDSGWNIQTVDSAGDVGWSSSLKIDSNNNAHISYLDNTNNALKIAEFNGLNWNIQTIDYVGETQTQDWFNQTSLALDKDGYPHISYFNALKGNLGYAFWNGSAWILQVADSNSNVGLCSSLALDQNGVAHISYFDLDNQRLKYISSVDADGFPSNSPEITPTPNPTPSNTPQPSPSIQPTPEPSLSPTPTPHVTVNSSIDLECKIESSNALNIQAFGILTADDKGVPNIDVLFSYSTDNGETWDVITTTKTNSTGQFFTQFGLHSSGVCLVKAFWSGNSSFLSASKTVDLILMQSENQIPLSMVSNSTLSFCEFNSTSKMFSFNVTGSQGTTGYISLYIAKSLVSDVSELTVYSDGQGLPYATESLGDLWLVSFSYRHSNHHVDIQLPCNQVQTSVDLFGPWILVLFFAPFALLVGVVLLIYRTKNSV